jgi:hypothetical protein
MKWICFFLAALGLAAQSRVGSGCATAYYIDVDCDGYGVGKKTSGKYPLGMNDTIGKPGSYTTGDMPDADDTDPAVHTTAEWEAKWGDGVSGMVKFLQERKKFSNSKRVWYVSMKGDNATARVNDPARPFRNLNPIVAALHDLQGGVIVIRGGVWGTELNFNPCGSNPCFHVTGTAQNPTYVIAYPGEKVETNSYVAGDNVYWPNKAIGHVTYDGLVFTAARYGIGDAVLMTDADHMTFVNCEFAGWHQLFWGNHSEDIVVQNNVFHDMMYHAVYFGSFQLEHTGDGDFDFAADEAAYAAGKSRGASHRALVIGNVMYNNGESGYDTIHINTIIDDVLVEGNIVSYSGGSAVTFQTGVYRSVIRNNVLFDNGRDAITFHLYGAEPPGLRGNTIENNTVWAGNPKDHIRGATPGGAVIMNDDSSAGRWIKDTTIRNNIFVVYNDGSSAASTVFTFRKNSFPDSHVIQNNIFWNSAPNASPADRVATISRDAYPDGRDAGNYTSKQLQGYGSRIGGNLYADPKFIDASPGYTVSPGKFNLELSPNSPAIDFGVAASVVQDARRRRRAGRPDAGAYEYTPAQK